MLHVSFIPAVAPAAFYSACNNSMSCERASKQDLHSRKQEKMSVPNENDAVSALLNVEGSAEGIGGIEYKTAISTRPESSMAWGDDDANLLQEGYIDQDKAGGKNSLERSAYSRTVATPSWSVQTIHERTTEAKLTRAKKVREENMLRIEEKKRLRKEAAGAAAAQRDRRAKIVAKFTPQELSELKSAFADADHDASGSIDAAELAMVVLKLGGKMPHNEISKLLKEMDSDGNGTVDLYEYLEFMVTMKTDENGGRSKTFMNHVEARITAVEDRRQKLALDKIAKRAEIVAAAEKARLEKSLRAEESIRLKKQEIVERNEAMEMKKALRLKEEREKNLLEISTKLKELEEKKKRSKQRVLEIEKKKRENAAKQHKMKQEEIRAKKERRAKLLAKERSETLAKARNLQVERERREKKAELLKKFTQNELSILKQLFQKYDVDGSGNIDTSELMTMLNSLGDDHDQKLISDMIDTIKPGVPGQLGFHEFLMLSEKLKHGVGGVKTSFLSISAKQKEVAKKRREDNYKLQQDKAARLKEKLDEDRSLHIKRVHALKERQKMELEKRASEAEQAVKARMTTLQNAKKQVERRREHMMAQVEQERVDLLKKKTDAMALSVRKRSEALSNSKNKSPIHIDKMSSMANRVKITAVYSGLPVPSGGGDGQSYLGSAWKVSSCRTSSRVGRNTSFKKVTGQLRRPHTTADGKWASMKTRTGAVMLKLKEVSLVEPSISYVVPPKKKRFNFQRGGKKCQQSPETCKQIRVEPWSTGGTGNADPSFYTETEPNSVLPRRFVRAAKAPPYTKIGPMYRKQVRPGRVIRVSRK